MSYLIITCYTSLLHLTPHYRRKHTAVKIWPAYPDLCIYVPDASRAVNVATSLMNQDKNYLGDVRKLYEKIQIDHTKTLQVRGTEFGNLHNENTEFNIFIEV